MGYAKRARVTGGLGKPVYIVRSSADYATVPKYGTLRWALQWLRGGCYIRFAKTMTIRLNARLFVPSHTSIDGRGAWVKIIGSLDVINVTNVIIHNIAVENEYGNHDLIHIRSSWRVWVDHCNVQNGVRGTVDVVRGSTDVTISNCYVHNKDLTMLLGAADWDSIDKRMRVTIYRNWFDKSGFYLTQPTMQTVIRLPASSRGVFIAGSATSTRSSAARPLTAVVARSGGSDSSPGSAQPPPAGGAQPQSGTSSGLSASSRPQSASASQPSPSSPAPPSSSSSSPLSLLSSPPPSVSANTRARLFDSPSPSSSSSPGRTWDPLEASFEGIMAFDGPGPELINGRLAMLGFVAGMSREVVGGVSLQQQLADPGETGIAALLLAAVLVSLASLPPLLKGVRPEDRSVWGGKERHVPKAASLSGQCMGAAML
ncbi:unnamed protein product [Closterium sp. Naga37s-1]|nr:unnamed protein product [Closterium sp. Naga37s-1]